MFPDLLRDGLWHTTSVERFNGILKIGFILPDPPIPDMERWGTALGPDLYPYVRSIGGVSIFDFTGFDEDTYSENYPLSDWRVFVPCYDKWDSSVWIELNSEAIGKDYIDARALIVQWKQQNAYRHRIMPYIEAAHIGPIPVSAFRQVFTFSTQTKEFTPLLR